MPQTQRVAGRDVLFEARAKQHLKDTNSPETMPGLNGSAPLKGQPFFFIFEFRLKPEKRPDRREAPCPICSPHSPKYFHGAMAWFPVEGVYRCIGIECAGRFIGKAETENAKRYMRESEARNRDYEFLFENLGCAPKMIRYLEALIPAANHAEKLRHDLSAAHVREPLRKALKSHDGQLRVWESHKVQRLHPATGEVRTVLERLPVEYGVLTGVTALAPKFNVLHKLRIAISHLKVMDHGDGDAASEWTLENAYSHPADMASFGSILRQAKPMRIRFESKIGDVLAFFNEGNFERLARFGADPRNPIPFYASFRNGSFRIGPIISESISIRPNFDILIGLPDWPELRAASMDT
jgi:hypothetical protein